MSLGLMLFTLAHVLLSLVGIVSGFLVAFDLFAGKSRAGMTALFLATTFATSATGFLFPFHGFLPSHKVGIVSLVVLAVAAIALYTKHLAGAWRRTYVVTAVIALYLNVFVLVAQAFQKLPALKALAPTQSEPPFLGAQAVVLAIFIAIGVVAAIRFRLPPGNPGAA
jgi:hypothetical protein